jgi:uncharacterized protein
MTPGNASFVAILLALVGVVGVVIPVLPGSVMVWLGLLLWAWYAHSVTAWVALGIGTVLLVVGQLAGAVLTKRELAQRQIPRWPLVVGLVVAVIGLFTVPVLGLPLGFVVGLLASEWVRLRDLRAAWTTSVAAVKTLGLGMIVELGCALSASAAMALSMVIVLW